MLAEDAAILAECRGRVVASDALGGLVLDELVEMRDHVDERYRNTSGDLGHVVLDGLAQTVLESDGEALPMENLACVDPLVHAVDGKPCFPDAFVDRPDDARASAKFRQNLAVDVDRAELGDAKDLREQIPVPER